MLEVVQDEIRDFYVDPKTCPSLSEKFGMLLKYLSEEFDILFYGRRLLELYFRACILRDLKISFGKCFYGLCRKADLRPSSFVNGRVREKICFLKKCAFDWGNG